MNCMATLRKSSIPSSTAADEPSLGLDWLQMSVSSFKAKCVKTIVACKEGSGFDGVHIVVF